LVEAALSGSCGGDTLINLWVPGVRIAVIYPMLGGR
jgi:hypothetical protein